MPNDKITPTSITFEYGENKSETVISNCPDYINVESVTLEKFCLSQNYFLGDNITYIIDIKNNSDVPLFNVKIKENMGKSKTEIESNSYSPLKYSGAFRYYINGETAAISEPKVYSDKIIFEIDALPALSNASIIYTAEITENAPLTEKSSITNTTSIIIPSTGKTLKSSHTTYVKEIADIKTIKQIKSSCGGSVTYSVFIYNYGNIPAKNVVIKDKIEHTYSSLNIKIDSKPINSSDYSLNSSDLQIPSYGSKYSISVPEAKFIKDENFDKFATVPGIVEITIECKI